MKTTDIYKCTEDGSIHRLVFEVKEMSFPPCIQCSLKELCWSGDKLLCFPNGKIIPQSFFIEENSVKVFKNVLLEVEGTKHRLVLMKNHVQCSQCSLCSACPDDSLICLKYVPYSKVAFARFIQIKK